MINSIKNYSSSDVDIDGNYYAGSDRTTAVHYYDASKESWKRDFTGTINPFVNSNFLNTTVTGTSIGTGDRRWYETGDFASSIGAVDGSRYIKLNTQPIYFREEILSSASIIEETTTLRGNTEEVNCDYFVQGNTAAVKAQDSKDRFPYCYGDESAVSTVEQYDVQGPWITSSGVTNDAYLSWSLPQPTYIYSFMVDSYQDYLSSGRTPQEVYNESIGYYEIQTAVSGTGIGDFGYSTIHSQYTELDTDPSTVILTSPVLAKYVRIVFRCKSGGTQSALTRVRMYTKEVVDKGMSALVHARTGASPGTFNLNQDVDLTSHDTVYYNLTNHHGATNLYPEIKVSGDLLDTPNKVADISYDSNTNDTQNVSYWGRSADVSNYTGINTFTVSRTRDSFSANTLYMALSGVTTIPPWFSEGFSTTRGKQGKFPDRSYIVADDTGLSIIDADYDTLWMRFEIGFLKVLEKLPTTVTAKDGVIYIGSTNGVYAIDFVRNKAICLDATGLRERFGIDKRNVEAYDKWNYLLDCTGQYLSGRYSLYAYCRLSEIPSLTSSCVNDMYVGREDTYGDLLLLATATGLAIHKGKLGDTSSSIYYSHDKLPVTYVVMLGKKVWYVQGKNKTARLKYIGDVNDIVETEFYPTGTMSTDLVYQDSLESYDSDKWVKHSGDSEISILHTGEFLSISGTHNSSGRSGLETIDDNQNRSFTLTAKVKINKFPPNARGGIRLGYSFNHFENGIYTGYSLAEKSSRQGVYLSAFNVDPYGTPVPESAPLTGPAFNAGWSYEHPPPGGQVSTQIIVPAHLDSSGLVIWQFSQFLAGSSSSDTFFWPTYMPRLGQTFGFTRRDFSVRAQVQLSQGYEVVGDQWYLNAYAILGVSSHEQIIPATEGSYSAVTDMVDGGMFVGANTTYSGVVVYTTGSSNRNGYASDVAYGVLSSPALPTENTGTVTSPFRDWRVDYDRNKHSVSAFLDGEYLGENYLDHLTQNELIGIVFGVGQRRQIPNSATPTLTTIKNIEIYLPEISEHSSFMYGVESSADNGIILPSFYSPGITTMSGLSMASDTMPASGTLSLQPLLMDGDYFNTNIQVQQDLSIGFYTGSPTIVDAVRIYDTASGTDGWYNSASKNVQLWYSDDNVFWTKYKDFNLTNEPRFSGLTELKLCPSVSGTYFKLTPTDTTYLVGGNTPWQVTELLPLTVSGTRFYGLDNTPEAEYREWKLTYDRDTKELVGYIDGGIVSKGIAPEFKSEGRFIISNDLSVVSSGTHSDIDVEIKDFKVVYSGPYDLGKGNLKNVSVSGPTTSGTDENYTIASATLSGVYILDRDFSSTPVSDRTISLQDLNNVKGNFYDVSVSLVEDNSSRGEGLLFIGTNRDELRLPNYEILSTRPYWFSRKEAAGDSYNNILYGNRATIANMANTNKYFIIFDEFASSMLSTDLRTGESTEIFRRDWVDANSLTGTAGYHLSHALATYVNRISTIWVWARGIQLCELDVNTSQVENYSSFNSVILAGSEEFNLVYSIHNNVVYYGQDQLYGVDVVTKNNISPFRHQASVLTVDNTFLNRDTDVPWMSSSFGTQASTYSDIDRSCYFLGKGDSDWNTNIYFCRYYPDQDYSEIVTSANEMEDDWPYKEEREGMARPGRAASSRIVYCPLDNNIYHLTTRGPHPVLKVFDVVTQQWKEVGTPPPYIANKGWPTSIGPSNAYDTNYLSYDPVEKALVMATGNYYLDTDKFFIYKPLLDERKPSFEYIPSLHGLPTSSGVHTQHSHSSEGYINLDVNTWQHGKDFSLQSGGSDSLGYSRFSDGPVTVFSGTSTSFQSQTDGANGLEQHIVTTRPLPSTGGFDVYFDFSMPSYSLNVFASSTGKFVTGGPPRAEFCVSVSDGHGQPWVYEPVDFYGEPSTSAHQTVSARFGVVGTAENDVTDYELKAYLRWVDGYNDGVDSTVYYPKNRMFGKDTYVSSPVDLVSSFTDYKRGHLSYDYVTDTVDFYVDGVSCGSYKLRRKFDPTYGLYLSLGYSYRSETDSGKEFVVNIKNLTFNRKSFEYLQGNSLVTSVSGAVGDYTYQRTDSTLLRNLDWVYECDMHFPRNFRSQGYAYIGTIGAMEDDYKVAELVAYASPSNKKGIALIGDYHNRDDIGTYLGTVEHLWDDIDIGSYRMEKDTKENSIKVFINGQAEPSITAAYSDLPSGASQRMYYGKVNYGSWEKIYTQPSKSGAWTSDFTLTGYGTPQSVEKMTIDSSAYFATIAQGSSAKATFTLDQGLQEVDLYAFFLSQGFDLANDTPYVVTSSGVVSLPVEVGTGKSIYSVHQYTDENSLYSPFKTLLRVDQTRDFQGTKSSADSSEAQTSGWVHLGRYLNPTSVVVTASGTVDTASTIGFVSVDAIGVDIGKYGKSTFDMSTRRVRYNTGSTSFYDDGDTYSSGLTVIDTNDGTVLATFGEDTPDQLKSGDITDGSKIG